MTVLDASVVLKWVFDDEDGGGRALQLKEGHIAGDDVIAVPDLLFYEVANVLATKTRLSEKDCAEAFQLLWGFELEQFDFGREEFVKALHLARHHAITVYDAAYVELSRKLRCRFVTADRRLYEKVKKMELVELL